MAGSSCRVEPGSWPQELIPISWSYSVSWCLHLGDTDAIRTIERVILPRIKTLLTGWTWGCSGNGRWNLAGIESFHHSIVRDTHPHTHSMVEVNTFVNKFWDSKSMYFWIRTLQMEVNLEETEVFQHCLNFITPIKIEHS